VVAFPALPNIVLGDAQGYLDFMRPLLKPWIEQAWVAIIDPLAKVVVRDSVTEAILSVTVEPLWVGWSRVQPLRTDVTVKKAVDSTTQRTVQFWIDFPADETIPDVRPGYEMVVIDGGNDPYLLLNKYVVTGALNSSMAWQRTINTFVDLESRPNYDTSSWPQRPVS